MTQAEIRTNRKATKSSDKGRFCSKQLSEGSGFLRQEKSNFDCIDRLGRYWQDMQTKKRFFKASARQR